MTWKGALVIGPRSHWLGLVVALQAACSTGPSPQSPGRGGSGGTAVGAGGSGGEGGEGGGGGTVAPACEAVGGALASCDPGACGRERCTREVRIGDEAGGRFARASAVRRGCDLLFGIDRDYGGAGNYINLVHADWHGTTISQKGIRPDQGTSRPLLASLGGTIVLARTAAPESSVLESVDLDQSPPGVTRLPAFPELDGREYPLFAHLVPTLDESALLLMAMHQLPAGGRPSLALVGRDGEVLSNWVDGFGTAAPEFSRLVAEDGGALFFGSEEGFDSLVVRRVRPVDGWFDPVEIEGVAGAFDALATPRGPLVATVKFPEGQAEVILLDPVSLAISTRLSLPVLAAGSQPRLVRLFRSSGSYWVVALGQNRDRLLVWDLGADLLPSTAPEPLEIPSGPADDVVWFDVSPDAIRLARFRTGALPESGLFFVEAAGCGR